MASQGIYSDIYAVEVPQCPLRSGARGWGPAFPIEIWSSQWTTRRRRRRLRRDAALIKSRNHHLAGGEKGCSTVILNFWISYSALKYCSPHELSISFHCFQRASFLVLQHILHRCLDVLGGTSGWVRPRLFRPWMLQPAYTVSYHILVVWWLSNGYLMVISWFYHDYTWLYLIILHVYIYIYVCIIFNGSYMAIHGL